MLRLRLEPETCPTVSPRATRRWRSPCSRTSVMVSCCWGSVMAVTPDYQQRHTHPSFPHSSVPSRLFGSLLVMQPSTAVSSANLSVDGTACCRSKDECPCSDGGEKLSERSTDGILRLTVWDPGAGSARAVHLLAVRASRTPAELNETVGLDVVQGRLWVSSTIAGAQTGSDQLIGGGSTAAV